MPQPICLSRQKKTSHRSKWWLVWPPGPWYKIDLQHSNFSKTPSLWRKIDL